MSIAQPIPQSSPVAPREHEWTKAEYYAMGEAGILDHRVELIEGRVIDMNAIGSRHAAVVSMTGIVLGRIGRNTHIRIQQPIDLLPLSEPQPDITVVGGTPANYAQAHPKTAELVVEVADASLTFDLTVKSELYAKGGLRDYWVIDLVHDQIHVFRLPTPNASANFGFQYSDKKIVARNSKLSPLAFPDIQLDAAEFFV